MIDRSKTKRSWRRAASALAGAALLAGAGAAPAQEANSDDWQFAAGVYLWGSSLKSTTGSGDEIDVDFSDLLDELDFAAMGAAELRKNDWSFLTDVQYVNLGIKRAGSIAGPGPLGRSLGVNANVDVTSWVLQFAVANEVHRDERVSLGLMAGARYVDIDVDLDLTANARRGARTRSVSTGTNAWDAVVGFRGALELGGQWFVPFSANMGKGESDLTYAAVGGIGYRFSWGEVLGTYRHMVWEFDNDEPIRDYQLSGPMIGVVGRF